jgi:ubiquinone/menaquinone biosynthesis C-methylase UbiE
MNSEPRGRPFLGDHCQVWDNYWSKIDKTDAKSYRMHNPYYRLLRRLLDLPGGDQGRILEIGCGSGMMGVALLDEIKGARYEAYLVDLSEPAISLARENSAFNKVDINLIRTDAFALPFPDNCFDIVYNEGLNEHFDGRRRQDIFNEMVRVCRPGGQVAVIVPNIVNLPYRLQKRLLEQRSQWEFGFEKAYSYRELRRRMSDAGLTASRRSGTKVARPVIDLMKSIFSIRINGMTGEGGESGRKISRNRFLRAVDDFLGRNFWFITRDIGMTGLKNGSLKI